MRGLGLMIVGHFAAVGSEHISVATRTTPRCRHTVCSSRALDHHRTPGCDQIRGAHLLLPGAKICRRSATTELLLRDY